MQEGKGWKGAPVGSSQSTGHRFVPRWFWNIWRLHILSGQPVPSLSHCTGKFFLKGMKTRHSTDLPGEILFHLGNSALTSGNSQDLGLFLYNWREVLDRNSGKLSKSSLISFCSHFQLHHVPTDIKGKFMRDRVGK